METNITRRRLVQGAGAIGVASVVGSTVVSAQEEGETGGDGDQQAAIRVAHASPDTPSVDVRLTRSGEAGTTETDGGLGEDNETGAEDGGNETVAQEDGGGNETEAGGEAEGDQEGEQTIEGVGFRDVTDYTEVEAGSHQIQLVVTEGGGFLEDLFGGGDDEEVVVLDDELVVESGTTYTVVACGEIAQAEDPERVAELQMPDEEGAESEAGMGGGEDGAASGEEEETPMAADGGAEDNATAVGEDDNATAIGEEDDATAVGEGDNATAVGEEDNATVAGEEEGGLGEEGEAGHDTSFRVKVLEDDLSEPGEESTRLRVFHAVADVQTVSISATSGGDGEDDQIGEENGTDLEGDEPGEEAPGDEGTGAGENETMAGDDNATAGETSEEGGLGAEAGGQSIDELEFGDHDTLELDAGDYTLEFRETAGAQPDGEAGMDEAGNATAEGEDDDDATAVGEGDNATEEGEDDGGLGGDDETAGGDNETAGGEDGEEVAEDAEGEEFEFVTVSDAENGERADGGTGGDGLF